MSVIKKALAEIKASIPEKILTLAFRGNRFESIDSKILNAVIRARVLVDCDLIGGETVSIPLNRAQLRYDGEDGTIFHIPKTLTAGRHIVIPKEVRRNDRQGLNLPGTYPVSNRDNTVVGAVDQLGDAYRTYGNSTTDLILVGENTIMSPQRIRLNDKVLICRVSNDPNMNNLKGYNIINFAEMCVMATKAEIHNRLVLLVDEGYISNGHELGVVKDIIDKYEDANEQYIEYRKTDWRKIAFMNDEVAMNNLIHYALGKGWS